MHAVVFVALPVFALILAGVVAARRKVLGRQATEVLNQYVVYLALPALLFQAMADIHPRDLAHPGFVGAFGGAIVLPYLAVVAIARVRGRRLADGAIQGLSATYANVGYMGIPLCLAAFGPASLVPSVITMVLTACVQFGAALAIVELDLQSHPRLGRTLASVAAALARNPLLIAPAAGFLWALTGLALPAPLARFLSLLGGSATPCALVATGLMLAERQAGFAPRLVSWLSAVKLLVQPALAWWLAARVLGLPPVWMKTAVVMSALPTGTGAFILASLYGREGASTSGTVLVSTVLSFATLPLLLVLLGTN